MARYVIHWNPLEINMAINIHKKLFAITLASVCIVSTPVYADKFTYEISITNLTRGQSFTPILAASHRRGVHLFTLGSPSSPELATLAEGGDTGPLTSLLEANHRVAEVKTSPGLLVPGKTATVTLKANKRARYLSMAAMLIPTNDAFMSLNAVPLPRRGYSVAYYAKAYDAGSEPNDELCVNIPGPVCGGSGPSPDADGEGYVHIHAGIHKLGDDLVELNAAERDWRNPVALVRIVRVRTEDN